MYDTPLMAKLYNIKTFTLMVTLKFWIVWRYARTDEGRVDDRAREDPKER